MLCLSLEWTAIGMERQWAPEGGLVNMPDILQAHCMELPLGIYLPC